MSVFKKLVCKIEKVGYYVKINIFARADVNAPSYKFYKDLV